MSTTNNKKAVRHVKKTTDLSKSNTVTTQIKKSNRIKKVAIESDNESDINSDINIDIDDTTNEESSNENDNDTKSKPKQKKVTNKEIVSNKKTNRTIKQIKHNVNIENNDITTKINQTGGLKDIKKINDDPEAYAREITIDRLVTILQKMSDYYYAKERPLVEDEIYDIMIDVLKEQRS